MFPSLAVAIALEWNWPTKLLGFPDPIGLAFGVSVCAAGALMIRWAKQSLQAFDQPSLPGEPTSRLITTGAFRVSRNPNYLGAVMIALGMGLAVDSLWFLGIALIAAAILDRWFIVPEERYLKSQFEESYADYRRQVRRWI